MTIIAWDTVCLISDSKMQLFNDDQSITECDIEKISCGNGGYINGEKIHAIAGSGITKIVNYVGTELQKSNVIFVSNELIELATETVRTFSTTGISNIDTGSAIMAICEKNVYCWCITFDTGVDVNITTHVFNKSVPIWLGSGAGALGAIGINAGTLNAIKAVEKAATLTNTCGGNYVQLYIDSSKKITTISKFSMRYKILKFVYNLIVR